MGEVIPPPQWNTHRKRTQQPRIDFSDLKTMTNTSEVKKVPTVE